MRPGLGKRPGAPASARGPRPERGPAVPGRAARRCSTHRGSGAFHYLLGDREVSVGPLAGGVWGEAVGAGGRARLGRDGSTRQIDKTGQSVPRVDWIESENSAETGQPLPPARVGTQARSASEGLFS